MENPALKQFVFSIKAKLSAYVVYYSCDIADMCIKADPLQLITIKVPISAGESVNIEEACSVGQLNEQRFHALIFNPDYKMQVTKGIVLKHPQLDVAEKKKEKDSDPTILIISAPDMTKDRHDDLIPVVKADYDKIKEEMEKEFGESMKDLTSSASKINPVDMLELKKDLDKVRTDAENDLTEKRDKVLAYIDKAYADYEQTKTEPSEQQEQDTDYKKMKL